MTFVMSLEKISEGRRNDSRLSDNESLQSARKTYKDRCLSRADVYILGRVVLKEKVSYLNIYAVIIGVSVGIEVVLGVAASIFIDASIDDADLLHVAVGHM
jgi:hypothetical protein